MPAIFTVTKKLILASGSPRRQEFLANLGLEFKVICREIDETPRALESPEKYVCRLAQAKAEVVARENPDAVVIGADTSVVCQDEILGKPVDGEHHLQMLKKISAVSHEVMTGFAVVSGGVSQMQVVCSTVRFHTFSDEVLKAYIASGDGQDKAGGYGMQSAGAFLVKEISGSHANVIGLPMTELICLLLDSGAIAPGCTS
jgi:septum formation protein